VSLDSKRTNEFRRYRQVLTALYLGTATAGSVLLAGSVVKELFFRRPAVELPASAISVDDPDPVQLLDCEQRVEHLLSLLGSETCELLAPPTSERSELPARWEDFSRAWRDEWDVVDARCRFSELADTKMGAAYDRLAKVHGDLQAMRLKYQSLLGRFDDEQAAELAQMRRALDLSRTVFEEKARSAGSRRPPSPSQIRPGTGVEPTPPAAPSLAGSHRSPSRAKRHI
jgi:hypothetical protein